MPLRAFGYKYCGPGTDLKKAGTPINALDEACKRHDEEYGSMSVSTHPYEADKRLYNAALQYGGPAGYAVAGAMAAKNIIDPLGFANYALVGDMHQEDDAQMEQDPGAGNETAADSNNTNSSGGTTSSGQGEVNSISRCLGPVSNNRYTRVFRNRQERILWNCQSGSWTDFSIPGQSQSPAAIYKWSDYFTVNDRILGFYLNPDETQHFSCRSNVAFRIKSARWHCVDSKVYIHSLNSGQTGYNNYQGIDPYIYMQTNTEYLPPYYWQSWSEVTPVSGDPPSASDTSLGTIINAEMQSKYRRVSLPRVAMGMAKYTIGNGPSINSDHLFSFTQDQSADFNYKTLQRCLASALPTSLGRSMQTWPNWIRAPSHTGFAQNFNGAQRMVHRWQNDNFVANGITGATSYKREPKLSDLGIYTLPVGPFSEDPAYTFLNPWTNSPPHPYDLGSGNTPILMKCEDVIDPAGQIKEISITMTFETELVVEFDDNANSCWDLTAFGNGGNVSQRASLVGRAKRILGDEPNKVYHDTEDITQGVGDSGLTQGFPNNQTVQRDNRLTQLGFFPVTRLEGANNACTTRLPCVYPEFVDTMNGAIENEGVACNNA